MPKNRKTNAERKSTPPTQQVADSKDLITLPDIAALIAKSKSAQAKADYDALNYVGLLVYAKSLEKTAPKEAKLIKEYAIEYMNLETFASDYLKKFNILNLKNTTDYTPKLIKESAQTAILAYAAKTHFKAKRYRQAMQCAEMAFSLYNNDNDSREYYVQAALLLGDQALLQSDSVFYAALQLAVGVDQENIKYALWLGKICLKRKEDLVRHLQLKKILLSDIIHQPTDVELLKEHFDFFHAFEPSAEEVDRIMKIEPSIPYLTPEDSKPPIETFAALTEAIKADPRQYLLYCKRAELCVMKGEFQLAEHNLRMAHWLINTTFDLHTNLDVRAKFHKFNRNLLVAMNKLKESREANNPYIYAINSLTTLKLSNPIRRDYEQVEKAVYVEYAAFVMRYATAYKTENEAVAKDYAHFALELDPDNVDAANFIINDQVKKLAADPVTLKSAIASIGTKLSTMVADFKKVFTTSKHPAAQALEEGHYDKAVEHALNALKLNPDDTESREYLIQAAPYHWDPDVRLNALKEADKLIAANGNNSEYHYWKIKNYFNSGNRKDANEPFIQMLMLDAKAEAPLSDEILKKRTNLFVGFEPNEEEIKRIDSAEDSVPCIRTSVIAFQRQSEFIRKGSINYSIDHFSLFCRQAEHYTAKGEFHAARRNIAIAHWLVYTSKTKPTNNVRLQLHLTKSNLFLAMGDFAESEKEYKIVEEFEKNKKSNREFSQLILKYAQEYLKFKKPKEDVIGYAQFAVKIDPMNTNAVYFLSIAETDFENLTAKLSDAKKADAGDSKEIKLDNPKVNLEQQLKELNYAIKNVENNFDAIFARAKTYRDLNKHELACLDFADVLRNASGNLGKFAFQDKLLPFAHTLEPSDDEINRIMGIKPSLKVFKANFTKNRFDCGTFKACCAAIKENPDDFQLYIARAEFYVERNEFIYAMKDIFLAQWIVQIKANVNRNIAEENFFQAFRASRELLTAMNKFDLAFNQLEVVFHFIVKLKNKYNETPTIDQKRLKAEEQSFSKLILKYANLYFETDRQKARAYVEFALKVDDENSAALMLQKKLNSVGDEKADVPTAPAVTPAPALTKKQKEAQARLAKKKEMEEKDQQRALRKKEFEKEKLKKEEEDKAKKAEETEKLRKAEEAKKAAEVAEKARKAAAAEKARKAEEAKKAAEAEKARKAEEARKAAEAEKARKAEEARKAAEAEKARKAEEARKAAEAEKARKAEEARKAAAAEKARKAEEAKKAAEAEKARKAEEAKKAAEAEKARKAEEAKKAAEAEKARKAEEARKAAEAEKARKAEEARKAAEAEKIKHAEEAKKAADAAKKAAEAEEAKKIKIPLRPIEIEILKRLKSLPGIKTAFGGGSIRDRVIEIKKAEEAKKSKADAKSEPATTDQKTESPNHNPMFNPLSDCDFVTTATKQQILALFKELGIQPSFHSPNKLFEILNPVKIEIWISDYPASAENWLELEASARCHTANALFCDSYDPATNLAVVLDPAKCDGIKHIEMKLMKTVDKNPANSYANDPIRMLRAVYGAVCKGFTIDGPELAAIQTTEIPFKDPKQISEFSSWMTKMLIRSDTRSKQFEELVKTGLIRKLFPALAPALENKENHAWIRQELNLLHPRNNLNDLYMIFMVCACQSMKKTSHFDFINFTRQTPLLNEQSKLLAPNIAHELMQKYEASWKKYFPTLATARNNKWNETSKTQARMPSSGLDIFEEDGSKAKLG